MIPAGLCQCGCGQKTNLSPRNHTKRGYVKGRPFRYIAGHEGKKAPFEIVEALETGCWNWQLSRFNDGYGQISARPGSKNRIAHRAYYEDFIGPIPKGLQLDHLCRNRGCVNPGHLEPVTSKENLERGRSGKSLQPQTVAEIRSLADEGWVQADIARAFGVSKSCVLGIFQRKNWKRLDQELALIGGSK